MFNIVSEKHCLLAFKIHTLYKCYRYKYPSIKNKVFALLIEEIFFRKYSTVYSSSRSIKPIVDSFSTIKSSTLSTFFLILKLVFISFI